MEGKNHTVSRNCEAEVHNQGEISNRKEVELGYEISAPSQVLGDPFPLVGLHLLKFP